MGIIKGPITIGKGGVSAADLIKEGKVKLPFTATGWTSEHNSDLVTGGVEAQPVKKKKKKKAKKV